MTERINHADEAKRLMAEIEHMDPATQWMVMTQKSLLVTSHIGLAAVEQERIANLIALTNRTVSFDDDMAFLGDEAANRLVEIERTPATPFGGPDEHVQVRADIREGLGL